MKIAISAINCSLENNMAPLFYKCRMFCVYSTDLNRADYYENPWYDHDGDYSIEIAEWLKNKNVDKAISIKFREAMKKALRSKDIIVDEWENDTITMEQVLERINQDL